MTKTSDISYRNEELNTNFNFRVALIAINHNRILLQKAAQDSFWSLIGGRVRLNEDTKSAIIREVWEETGIVVSKDDLKLIKIIENFFNYNDIKFHEILYIYKVDGNAAFNNSDEFKTLDKNNVINKWINIDKLDSIDLRPEIVKKCYNDNSLSSELIN